MPCQPQGNSWSRKNPLVSHKKSILPAVVPGKNFPPQPATTNGARQNHRGNPPPAGEFFLFPLTILAQH